MVLTECAHVWDTPTEMTLRGESHLCPTISEAKSSDAERVQKRALTTKDQRKAQLCRELNSESKGSSSGFGHYWGKQKS